MGELDEKEAAPASHPTTTTPTTDVISVDEPKETETLLAAETKSNADSLTDNPAVAATAAAATPSAIDSPKSAASTTVTIEKEPEEVATPLAIVADSGNNAAGVGNDKEKEKLLPTSTSIDDAAAAAAVAPEGREVKPKKIPIGGIKMPGFFTKSKPKTEGDGADGELLEKIATDADVPAAKGDAKDVESGADQLAEGKKSVQPGWFASLLQRNPFAKRQPVKTSDENDDVKEIKIEDGTNGTTEKSTEADANDDSTATTRPPKKGLLNAIRLPIPNIISKKLRPVNGPATDAAAATVEDVELGIGTGGGGPHNKAGLASMETLDDSLKDTDNGGKDVTDKSATIKADDLETINLNEASGKEKDKADKEKQEEAAAAGGAKPAISLLETIRAYRCSVDDMAIAGGLLLFVLLVCVICAFTITGHGEVKSAPVRDGKFVVAHTICGPVEGMMEDSAFAFRGIPFARAPIGELRFKPAQPIESMDYCWNGTLQAHESGAMCRQLGRNVSSDDGSSTLFGQEDCLTLDVITPHVRYDNPLPVVVLFGAETFVGESPGVLRPSARFARKNDVIFVRPNFRLGVFGFLSVGMISQQEHPPTSGNYGLSDMLAALRWIQLNIAHFGGNPKSVTLFGHRTGATLVTALVTSARSENLYTRAWVTSGAGTFPGKTLAESEGRNVAFEQLARAQHSACNVSATCIRSLAVENVEMPPQWGELVHDTLPLSNDATSNRHDWLVLDGAILKQNPSEVWNREIGGPTKLVIGSTMHSAHSARLWQMAHGWSADEVRQYVEDSIVGQKNLTDEALRRYNATYSGLVAMISDIRTLCPLLTMARLQPSAPFYVVTQLDDGTNDAMATKRKQQEETGSSSSSPLATVDADVLAILGRYEPKTPEQRRYVSAIQQLFYHYVSHGEMRQFESNRRVLNIGQDAQSMEDYPNCNFWIENDVVPRHAQLD